MYSVFLEYELQKAQKRDKKIIFLNLGVSLYQNSVFMEKIGKNICFGVGEMFDRHGFYTQCNTISNS